MGIEKRLCWLMSASTLSRICLLVREFAVQNCIGECIQVRICHFHKLNSILNSFRRYRKSEAQKGVNIDLMEGPCPPTHSPMGPTLLQKVEFLVFYCIFFIIIYLIFSFNFFSIKLVSNFTPFHEEKHYLHNHLYYQLQKTSFILMPLVIYLEMSEGMKWKFLNFKIF